MNNELDRLLRDGGWSPGRRVGIDDWYAYRNGYWARGLHAASEAFLSEFSGLIIGQSGPGEVFAKSQVTMLAERVAFIQDFSEFEQATGVLVDPVGDVDAGNGTLGCGNDGFFYYCTFDGAEDPVERIGANPREALCALLTGKAAVKIAWKNVARERSGPDSGVR